MQILMKCGLWLLVFALWANGAQAQKESQRRFSASVVAGFNAAQIDGDNDAGFRKLGLNLGGRADIFLAQRWGVSTEILFSQKGSQSMYVRGQPRNLQCNLNYVEVPVEINFKDWLISDIDNGNPYMRMVFGAGLSYNRFLGGSLVISGLDEGIDRFKQEELAILFSGSAYINRHWAINLRWTRSLTSITETNSGWGAAVNRMLVMRLFYTFQ